MKHSGDDPHKYALYGWHLDRRITIGNIVAWLLAVSSVGYFIVTLESRTELNAAAIQSNKELTDQRVKSVEQRLDANDRRNERALNDLKSQMKEGFDDVKNDMRYLIERLDEQDNEDR